MHTASKLAMTCAAMVLVVSAAAAQSPHSHHHRFDDAAKWAQVFDDPSRDAWQKPHEVIQALAPKPDAAIADIGAGTGYFTARLARMTPRGKVYAIDTEPDMVRYVAERAKRAGLANVVALQGQPDDPGLPQKVDLALFVDAYHHVENRDRYLRRLRESLAPGGRVAVIDFRMEAPIGPPRSARIAPAEVKDEFRRAGYALAAEHDFLPHQYFLVFAPSER